MLPNLPEMAKMASMIRMLLTHQRNQHHSTFHLNNNGPVCPSRTQCITNNTCLLSNNKLSHTKIMLLNNNAVDIPCLQLEFPSSIRIKHSSACWDTKRLRLVFSLIPDT